MFTSSLAALSFASIFSVLPPPDINSLDIESGSSIVRHNSPAIAGLWELDIGLMVNTVTTQPTQHMQTEPEATEQVQSHAGLIIRETVIIQGAKPAPLASLPSDNVNEAATTAVYNSSQCRERYNFAADTSMWTVSGAEWSSGEYLVQPISDDSDSLPLLVMKTIYDNNQPDCTNSQVDQTGGILAVYLKYLPNEGRMSWCKDANGETCIMHFKRVLP